MWSVAPEALGCGNEMDTPTPERSKIAGTPLSKFEDSPVFNFINNLSPIQPVKPLDSLHFAQTYQSLNFASLSSIFSSPHANPPKETRFLTRPPFTDFTKQENFSENVGESSLSSEVSHDVRPSLFTGSAQENHTITCSLNEATIDPPDQCPSGPNTFSQSTQYDSCSPDHNTAPCNDIKMDVKINICQTQVEFHLVQNGAERRKTLFAMETEVQENHQLMLQKEEVLGNDWENLISDGGDNLFNFDSNMETDIHEEAGEKANNNGTSFISEMLNCTDNADHLQKTHPDIWRAPCSHNVTKDPALNCGEGSSMDNETDLTKKVQSSSKDQVDAHQQRGMRRRCLVYELASVSKRNVHAEPNITELTALPSKGKSICETSNLNTKTNPSLCALPGIGLHLNALATTSKERLVNKETPAFVKATNERNNVTNSLSVEEDFCPVDREVDLQIVHYDDPKDATVNNYEELSQGSPKKKRRKSDNGGDSDGCKRCNCKKSKCLKLYCECFAAGVYCSEPCSCQGCFNKPIHEETVLSTRKQIESRNPLAFAPKVIRTSESGLETGDDDKKTPASARHKRGCNCKKSNCLKKYCECYQGGVGCSVNCRCEGCKNLFGRQDGTMPGVEEIEQVVKDTDICEKEDESLDDDQQKTNIQNEHQSSGNALPITSLQSNRRSIDMPFFPSIKVPQSTRLSIGRSPGLYVSHIIRKSEMVLPQPKLDNNVTAALEDDTPAILRSTATPTAGVKIASPNRKRVSPPHNGDGSSPPNRKGCRKLILRSIPSFPSLSNEAFSEHPVDNNSKS